MDRLRAGLIGVFLSVFAVWPAVAEDNRPAQRVITLYGGEKQGPVVCNGSSVGPGMLTERAVELFRRAGYAVRIECTAWNRAQTVVKSDPDGVVLNMARTPEREGDYIWLLKTGELDYGIATADPSLRTLEAALQKGMVAAVRGTPRVTELQAIGPERHIVQVNDPEQAARMLTSGRVVAWYDTSTRIERFWPDGSNASSRPFFVPTRRIAGYLAAGFALRDEGRIRAQLEQAFTAMKADGSWAAIGRRYAGLAR